MMVISMVGDMKSHRSISVAPMYDEMVQATAKALDCSYSEAVERLISTGNPVKLLGQELAILQAKYNLAGYDLEARVVKKVI